MGDNGATPTTATIDEDLLLKQFFAEVSEVERDNEVSRLEFSFSLSQLVVLCLHMYVKIILLFLLYILFVLIFVPFLYSTRVLDTYACFLCAVVIEFGVLCAQGVN